MLASLVCIWLLLILNIFLIIGGYLYYLETTKYLPPKPASYPRKIQE